MNINEGTTIEDLWTPYKELVSVVEGYLAHESGGAPYAVHTFESVLRRHKQTFLSLLKYPPKNPTSREEIKKGVTEGVNLPSVGRTLLSKELVDEAIIISDMYNVNEYVCLELLHTAQRQAPRQPGLARGLLAVLLLHDGRRALVQALRHLVMARDGVSWCISRREEIVSYVSRYVSQLLADGAAGGVLDALRRCELDAELQLLQANRALPPPRHHLRLIHTIETTRKLLAGVIFAASAQRGLDRDILIRLYREQMSSATHGPTGALDEVSLALQMALLYALDLSVLHKREDGEELAKKLPLIQDPELISVLLDEFSPPMNPNQTQEGQDKGSGLRALCQLALGLALAALKRAPQTLLRASNSGEIKSELLDQDDVLVDTAIDGKVFEYVSEALLSAGLVRGEEYYQRRLHSLLTDFIVLMHSKLMEMRVKADEAARAVQMYAAEGLSAPGGAAGGAGGAGGAGRTRLHALLRCVERLYEHDALQLRHDYWPAALSRGGGGGGGGGGSGREATLYKFVRLSGEAVCAALLAAYLRALAALAVPKHTWALLARRDALSAHHLLTALQLYHRNLRADPAPFAEHLHSSSLGASAIVTPAARPGKLLVRQEEVEAMIASLKLIAAVARIDEAASAAICENLQWDAVNCMFGLMCCHVPIQLKAALCRTLAALGARVSTAPRVWAALDAAQLVSTADKRGLNAELQEMECRMEEYPLSRAFLELMEALCAVGPAPRALGAGSRAPGLQPYLHHVLHRLALPAPHRRYAVPHEEWQVIALCFRLFARWLEEYEPSAADFPAVGAVVAGSVVGAEGAGDAEPPPGFSLLVQLHSESELLRLVLGTLDRANDLLDRQPGPGKEYVEDALVSTLQMLERALALERALSDAAGEAGRALLVVGLSKLLLAPEGPDRCDRLVSCCRVVGRGALPAGARRAVSLLRRALLSPHSARHLLASLAHRHALAADIRHGFVECLESEEWCGAVVGAGAGGGAAAEQHEQSAAEEARAAKEGVVLLVLQLLPAAAPNFAHFLLGYQLNDDVSRSVLNEAGVGGSPRTVLHAVLDILDHHIAPAAHEREATPLVESCYRLVYWLCARPATSPPALRLLRARDYFLARHVKATVNLETASVTTVSARSWVLRACACEAGAAGGTRQHAALAALLAALTHTPHHPEQEWEWCMIRRALEGLAVSVAAPAEPRWELFHAHQLRSAINDCDLPTGVGSKRISVSRLHALLARELAALRTTAPQRSLVALEIEKVLDYVTEVNRQRNLAATLTHYYDSWRQLTEIIFCVAPSDVLALESRKNLLLNILQDLLNKIPPAEVLPQLGNLASGTVLLLLVNLRHCYILQKRESNLDSSEFEASFFGPSNQIMQSKSLTLKFILHKILGWILVSGGGTQKMRVNLYGALLNFLNIVNLKASPAEPEEEGDATYVSRLDASRARAPRARDHSALKAMVIDVISGFGEKLCAIVCSDCAGAGHDVCRMAALACLDTLLHLHPASDWLHTLTDQGYLRSLIDSLLHDDDGLKEALEPSPKSLRVLYVYECKMSLLLKLAGSRRGAETVVSQGALACLASLSALSCHPDVHAATSRPDIDFVPSVASRFRQMLVPALALCDALLTSLGTENHSCVIHVTHFLVSHVECIDMVLRAAHPNSPEGLLVELEWVTSVVSRASGREVFGLARGDTALQRAEPSLQRVQWLMLALLPRFQHPPPPGLGPNLAPNVAGPATEHTDNRLYLKIVCNLLTYALNTLEREDARVTSHSASSAACAAARALLQHLAHAHRLHAKLLATVAHQLHNLPAMTLDDMKKLVCEEAGAGRSPGEVRAGAAALLVSRVRVRRAELQYCGAALAQALYLLWAHARLHLQAAAPHELGMSVCGAVSGAGGAELGALRADLVALFNDRFVEDLLDTLKGEPPLQRGFVEVLLKDIKRIIQFTPV